MNQGEVMGRERGDGTCLTDRSARVYLARSLSAFGPNIASKPSGAPEQGSKLWRESRSRREERSFRSCP